jgi:hypothetical protein
MIDTRLKKSKATQNPKPYCYKKAQYKGKIKKNLSYKCKILHYVDLALL